VWVSGTLARTAPLPHKTPQNAQTHANPMLPVPSVPGMMSRCTTATRGTRHEKWDKNAGLSSKIHHFLLQNKMTFEEDRLPEESF
jgi:hypothetical protein